VHSMIEFEDGCVLAQLGVPDMRAPIAYAMSFPQRMPATGRKLDLAQAASLTFEQPDMEKFPALRLAREALRTGGTAACIFNGANEEAVGAFLAGKIPFGEITPVVEETMARAQIGSMTGIEAVQEADGQARSIAAELLASRVS